MLMPAVAGGLSPYRRGDAAGRVQRRAAFLRAARTRSATRPTARSSALQLLEESAGRPTPVGSAPRRGNSRASHSHRHPARTADWSALRRAVADCPAEQRLATSMAPRRLISDHSRASLLWQPHSAAIAARRRLVSRRRARNRTPSSRSAATSPSPSARPSCPSASPRHPSRAPPTGRSAPLRVRGSHGRSASCPTSRPWRGR